jgi:hypothetical protein
VLDWKGHSLGRKSDLLCTRMERSWNAHSQKGLKEVVQESDSHANYISPTTHHHKSRDPKPSEIVKSWSGLNDNSNSVEIYILTHSQIAMSNYKI